MKKPNLKNLISKTKWHYLNDNITEKNFPVPEKIETEGYKVIKLEKNTSSEDCLKLIKDVGCRPANIYELLLLKENHPELWPDNVWTSMVAFGSELKDLFGYHGVPRLSRGSGGDWRFGLGCFGSDWFDDDCLLCFCDKTLDTQTLNFPEPLTLRKAIDVVKEAGYKIYKEM